MKSNWTAWTTALVAAALGLFASAPASASLGEGVEASVPFRFFAGNESFPAGRYLFTVDDPTEPARLTIRRVGGSAAVEVLLTVAESDPSIPTRSKVIFDQSGGDHVLAKVVVAGLDEARVLTRAEIEREYGTAVEQREVPARAFPSRH
jgi:hypothetical protein